ncbi:hypothetical protein EAF00_005140 [Botryotinia globosa]|nr:hypothetical protein EAF00_005140 [Botryotinia globosa]
MRGYLISWLATEEAALFSDIVITLSPLHTQGIIPGQQSHFGNLDFLKPLEDKSTGVGYNPSPTSRHPALGQTHTVPRVPLHNPTPDP